MADVAVDTPKGLAADVAVGPPKTPPPPTGDVTPMLPPLVQPKPPLPPPRLLLVVEEPPQLIFPSPEPVPPEPVPPQFIPALPEDATVVESIPPQLTFVTSVEGGEEMSSSANAAYLSEFMEWYLSEIDEMEAAEVWGAWELVGVAVNGCKPSPPPLKGCKGADNGGNPVGAAGWECDGAEPKLLKSAKPPETVLALELEDVGAKGSTVAVV